MTALFAIFFPIGAIIVKVLKAPNAGRIHGVWQGISYVGSSAGFGIGVYLATMEENVSNNIAVVSVKYQTLIESRGSHTKDTPSLVPLSPGCCFSNPSLAIYTTGATLNTVKGRRLA